MGGLFRKSKKPMGVAAINHNLQDTINNLHVPPPFESSQLTQMPAQAPDPATSSTPSSVTNIGNSSSTTVHD